MDLRPHYRALVASTDAMADLSGAACPRELLQRLREAWALDDVGDDALVTALNECNLDVHALGPEVMAGHWFPHRYHAASRSLAWCPPQGPATEPFQDEYILRCRQHLVAQFIQPRTAIAPLLAPAPVPATLPAGFIFHLSRCGSTLLSGCLSELDDTCVLSEAPALTEVVLDASLPVEDKQRLLRGLVALQAAAMPGRDRIIVKWNAWDLFAWPLIRAAFPGVPCVLLTREPEEILASHARSAGRHMVADPTLAALAPVFAAGAEFVSLLDHRIRVLEALMEAMADLRGAPGAWVLDYARWSTEALAAACRHFGLAPGKGAWARACARTAVHSKDPAQAFRPDGEAKRQWFDAGDGNAIRQRLSAVYARLLRGAEQRDAAGGPLAGPG